MKNKGFRFNAFAAVENFLNSYFTELYLIAIENIFAFYEFKRSFHETKLSFYGDEMPFRFYVVNLALRFKI